MNNSAFTIFSILFLFLFTLLFLSIEKFHCKQFILLLISYLFGLIIAFFLFPFDFILKFVYIVLISFVYYLLVNKFPMLSIIILNKFQLKDELENLSDLKITLSRLWNLDVENIKFYRSNFFGTFIRVKKKPYKIYIGEQLLNILNFDEMVFVLSHEIGHQDESSKKQGKNLIIFFVIFMALSYSIAYILSRYGWTNLFILIGFSLTLTLIGLVFVHLIIWRIELNADRLAYNKIGNIITIETAFKKMSKERPDINENFLFNLIFFDHPPIIFRIKSLKKLDEGN